MIRPPIQPITRLVLVALLCAAPAWAETAWAETDCAVPMSDWQPRSAVVRLAAANGWAIRRIRIDDGCYEVTGKTATGQSFEMKLNPATLAVVETEYEEPDEQDDEHGGEHGEEHGGDEGRSESGRSDGKPAPQRINATD